MFLSNRHAAALAFSLAIFVGVGCGWIRNQDPPPQTSAPIAPPETGIPFETKELETYQADFVTSAGGVETNIHFARKAGRWRFDSFEGAELSRSIVRGDSLAYLDHRRKIYSEPAVQGPDAAPPFINDLTTTLLNEKQAGKFAKVSTEGNLETYSVTVEGSNGPATIVYDTSIKMVIRHEFEGGFAFEMRNFTLDVDDAIFSVPGGYRKVAWTVFNQQ